MLAFSCGSGVSVWQNKNPTAGWQWGSLNPVNESEPDRRAAQQQRVQQQVQIQIAIHSDNVTIASGCVKWFFVPLLRRFHRRNRHSVWKLFSTPTAKITSLAS